MGEAKRGGANKIIRDGRTRRLNEILTEQGLGGTEGFCRRYCTGTPKLVSEVLYGKSGGKGSAGEPVFAGLLEAVGESTLRRLIVPWPGGKGTKPAGHRYSRELQELLRANGYRSLGDFSMRHGGEPGILHRILRCSGGEQEPNVAATLWALEALIGSETVARLRKEAHEDIKARRREERRGLNFCQPFLLACAAHELTVEEFARLHGSDKETVARIYRGRLKCDSAALAALREEMRSLVSAYELGAVRPRTLLGAVRLRALELGITVDEVVALLGVPDKAWRAYREVRTLRPEQVGLLRRVGRVEFGIDFDRDEKADVRQLLGEAGITVQDLARELGVADAAVCHVLSGRGRLANSGAVLGLIARKSGHTVDEVAAMIRWHKDTLPGPGGAGG